MKKRMIIVFLALEAVLYACILTCGGTLLVATSYASIVLCGLYGLLLGQKKNRFLRLGLLLTVGADFCLVVCDPIRQLWGMVFFLGAQVMYALQLGGRPWRWWLRCAVSLGAPAVTALVLGENTDALAMVSVCYYGNLILNLLFAFLDKDHMLGIAFVLFLLCDTVIGLQVASSGYLPIGEGSLLHQLLFSGFNLAWLFYLPSQVLLALGTHGESKNANP